MAEATLNGTLTNDGGAPCDCRFEYGLTIAYGTFTQWVPGYVTGDTYREVVYGLLNGTLYYYRALARNLAGVAVAAGTSFTTMPALPVILTVAATAIDPHSALLNFNLVDDSGSPCLVWFEYGATIDYGMETGQLISQESPVTGGIDVQSLGAGVPFHFRAVAQNRYGVGYGANMVFTTLSNLSPRSGMSMELMLLLEEE